MSCRFTLERGSSESVPAIFGEGDSSCFQIRSVASLTWVCSGEVCGSVFCLFAGTSGMAAGTTHLSRAALSCAMASANVYRDWAKCFMAHHPHKDLKIEDNGNTAQYRTNVSADCPQCLKQAVAPMPAELEAAKICKA
eukprot:s1456_g7.t1